MNLIPKLCSIELTQYYCDGSINQTTTSSPRYYWLGKKHYKWLWFEFNRKLISGRDYIVFAGQVTFTEIYGSNVEITISYCDK